MEDTPNRFCLLDVNDEPAYMSKASFAKDIAPTNSGMRSTVRVEQYGGSYTRIIVDFNLRIDKGWEHSQHEALSYHLGSVVFYGCDLTKVEGGVAEDKAEILNILRLHNPEVAENHADRFYKLVVAAEKIHVSIDNVQCARLMARDRRTKDNNGVCTLMSIVPAWMRFMMNKQGYTGEDVRIVLPITQFVSDEVHDKTLRMLQSALANDRTTSSSWTFAPFFGDHNPPHILRPDPAQERRWPIMEKVFPLRQTYADKEDFMVAQINGSLFSLKAEQTRDNKRASEQAHERMVTAVNDMQHPNPPSAWASGVFKYILDFKTPIITTAPATTPGDKFPWMKYVLNTPDHGKVHPGLLRSWENLNNDQKNVYEKMLNGTELRLLFVNGVAGCGKSYLMKFFMLMVQFGENGKVHPAKFLYVLPQNANVSDFARKLTEEGKQVDSPVQSVSLHEIGSEKKIDKPLKPNLFKRLQIQEAMSVEDEEDLMGEPDGYLEGFSGCISGTPHEVASRPFSKSYRPDFIFVDDACRVSEGQFLSVIRHFEPALLAAMGDTRQLPVYVNPDSGTKNPWRKLVEQSTLARAVANGAHYIDLKINHRSHGKLGSQPSDLFYNHKMTLAADHDEHKIQLNLWKQFLQRSLGIGSYKGHRILVEMPMSAATASDKSLINHVHSVFAVDIAVASVNDDSLNAKDILIIAFYKAQVQEIKQELDTRVYRKQLTSDQANSIKVSTVDSAQGDEASFVIWDTVQTERVGFTADIRRVNIATTRSKYAEIVLLESRSFAEVVKRKFTYDNDPLVQPSILKDIYDRLVRNGAHFSLDCCSRCHVSFNVDGSAESVLEWRGGHVCTTRAGDGGDRW